MKKLLYILLIVVMFPMVVKADTKVKVYIFTKEDEEYSASALEFFKELKESDIGKYFEYKNIEIWDKNWQEDYNKREIADKVVSYFDDTLLGAPYIVVGSKYHLSTFTEDYGDEIKEAITKAYEKKDNVDLYQKADKEIKIEQKKNTISLISISAGTIILTSLFIIIARKNND